MRAPAGRRFAQTRNFTSLLSHRLANQFSKGHKNDPSVKKCLGHIRGLKGQESIAQALAWV
jgi:hypothetical protein